MKLVSIWHGAIHAEYQKRYVELARLGWSVTLIAPRQWRAGLSAPATLERLNSSDFELVALPVSLAGHGATFFYRGLHAALDRARPDVIECIEEPFSIAAWQALRWRMRNAPQAPFIISTCQNIFKTYPPPFRWIEKYVLQHSSALTGLNAESLEVFRRKGFRGPTLVVPTGIDPQIFHPATDAVERKSAGRIPRLAYVGRLAPEKGVDTLLRAAALLDAPFQLVIAGDGPELPRLKKLAEELSIARRVEWPGTIAHGRIADFYRACDCVILPSRTTPHWKEQLGRVLIEAMACGVPVIGSNSGEIPNVIGDAGLIFPEGDANALSAHINKLLRDCKLFGQLSAKCSERARRHYTWHAIVQSLDKLPRSLVP